MWFILATLRSISKSRQERFKRRVEKILAAKRADGKFRRTLSKHEIAKLQGVPFKKRVTEVKKTKKHREVPWPDTNIGDLLDEFVKRGERSRNQEHNKDFGRLADDIRWLRTQIEIRMLERLLK
jgi:hypothetical protein